MHAIQEWINNHLIEWGIISSSANELDNTIVLLLIIAVTVGIDYACRYIFLNMFKRLAKRTRNQWDDLIVERKIINKLMHMIPAILVYVLLPLAFPVDETPKILGILQMICKIYIIAVSLRFISASLNVVHEIYNRKESLKNKPLKGFIQLLQVAVFFIGFILIISILIGKSPTTLFAGLGASAAILMLVFKDTLLGFVAGIQLSANDMLRPGDWITMEKYGANGTVIEVTLNAVKVKNFDNTITTIPPYALVSDAFQNWRGMSESPGRRMSVPPPAHSRDCSNREGPLCSRYLSCSSPYPLRFLQRRRSAQFSASKTAPHIPESTALIHFHPGVGRDQMGNICVGSEESPLFFAVFIRCPYDAAVAQVQPQIVLFA